MNLRRSTLLAVVLIASAGIPLVLASWHPHFVVTTDPDTPNLVMDYGQTYIHFHIDGLKQNSVSVNADLPEMHAIGASISFFIEVFQMESVQEVKLILCEDVILLWKKSGSTVKWAIWNGRHFKYLGNSAILPGTGKHSVTYVRSEESFILFEDGIIKKSIKSPKSQVLPKFYMKAVGRKAVLHMSITDIQIHNGVPPSETVF